MTQESSSMFWRGLAYFDPARDGFIRRMLRLVGLLSLLALVAVVIAVALLLNTPQGRFWKGVTQIEARQYDAAVVTTRALVKAYPDTDRGYYLLLATSLRRVGDYDGSVAAFEDGAKVFPKDAYFQGKRCWNGILFGDPKRYLPACDAAVDGLETDRDLALALSYRAVGRALTGDRQGAVDDLQASKTKWQRAGGGGRLERRADDWLQALERGEDPFTEEALDQERRRF